MRRGSISHSSKRFAIAALVAVCAAAPATASSAAGGEAEASTVGLGPQPRGAQDEYAESLGLFVSRRPQQFKRATVRAEGVADPALTLRLWVYEDRRGRPCPATLADRKLHTRTLIGGLPVDGAFSEQRRPRMKDPGRHTFCAYLGPDEDTADTTSFVSRKVRRPLLRAGRARRTVLAALRRHAFANRVIENLEQNCSRRSRSKFECRFSSSFPGYSLTGRGPVVLKRRLSYRFQASVRGRSLVLTDENEGRFPG